MHEILKQFDWLIHHYGAGDLRLRKYLRAVQWGVHCLVHRPGWAYFRRWDFHLYLPPIWFGGGATTLFVFREYYDVELRLLERFLRPGMTFVDGGAHFGVYTFTAARIVGPQGHVLSFDPGPTCSLALGQTRHRNGLTQVVLHKQALFSERGKMRFYHHNDSQLAFSLGAPPDGSVPFEEVETTTIQDALGEQHLDRVDFIKLDVEGAEEIVLRSSRPLLEKNQPVVLFESNTEACRRFKLTQQGTLTALRELGYRIHAIGEAGELTEITRAEEGVVNYVALHPARHTTAGLIAS